MALFKWSYRRLREKIEQGDQSANFLKFVHSCFVDVGRNYVEEFGEHPYNTPVTDSPQPDDTPVTGRPQPADIEVAELPQPADIGVADRPQPSVTIESQPTDSPGADRPVVDSEYRRGKTVYFSSQQSSEVNKGMVLNLTPRKRHIKVATSSKERPITVPVDSLQEPPPQPLKHQTFIISGNIAERGEKERVNTEKLTEIIKNLGGTIFNGDIEKAADASFVIVTSQKEIDKQTQKLNKT